MMTKICRYLADFGSIWKSIPSSISWRPGDSSSKISESGYFAASPEDKYAWNIGKDWGKPGLTCQSLNCSRIDFEAAGERNPPQTTTNIEKAVAT